MKILATTDGSDCSNAALGQLGRLIRPADAEIVLLSVVDTTFLELATPPYIDEEILEEIEQAYQGFLEAGRRILETQGFAVRTRIEEGHPSTAILEVAASESADLIAVGAHGERGLARLLLGSVSTGVVNHAERSVLVIRPAGALQAGGPLRVLATTDGSACSLDALDQLGSYLAPDRTQVELLTVQPPIEGVWAPIRPILKRDAARAERLRASIRQRHEGFLEDGRRRLEKQGFAVTTSALEGDAADVLLEQAIAEKVDLLVLGCHGRTGFNRLLMGSISGRSATHARCSVLVLRAKHPAM